MTKTLSIITVVLNDAGGLRRTLHSIEEQTFQDFESIVIDGGSTDGTIDVMEESRRVDIQISEKDEGIFDAMNKGISRASGQWIQFLNAGDVLYSNDTLEKVFDRDIPEHVVLLYGDTILVKPDKELYFEPYSLNLDLIRKKMGVNHQSILIRNRWCPAYDIRYPYKSEYKWLIKLVKNYGERRFKYINQPIAKFYNDPEALDRIPTKVKETIGIVYEEFGLIRVLCNLHRYFYYLLRFAKHRLTRSRRHNDT